ncbi:hypothetical protein G6F57_007822 [Rhizopus arrhizus]|nr:hypothetical protein G6F30_008441 [Rhizopus arrhizus]KAG1421141.1 hypothetical protein G6F58_003873 [Rhizopus delemar]KAG0988080.1 hypothetical protein G6F29_002006 [Rhizopus arrhizus]KAG0999106.1 hypothetical protein G6F28_001313 [Rhizopus arrhizus]KAG1005668.1 hypothetical protein G6F27_009013 [Rhizopus arrhizus]
MAFNFGANNTNKPATTGFGFGTTGTNNTAAPITGFTFGSSTTAPSAGAFGSTSSAPATSGGFGGFGNTSTAGGFGGFGATTSAPASTGFNLAASSTPAASTATSAPSFGGFGTTSTTGSGFGGFGTAASKPATGFGAAATTTAPATTGFSFGASSTPASTGTTPATSAPSTGFGFGASNTATSAATTPATSAPSTGFGFGASTAGSKPSFSFGASAAATPSSATATAPASTTTTATGTTSTGGFSGFGQKTTATQPTATTGQQPALTTQPTVSKPASVPTPSTLKNKTMEDILNLWTRELEKQTKDFHAQASQVAQWDQQLIENGNKIATLHENVKKVEVIQTEIDENLGYINTQQEELSSLLDQYEKQIKDVFNDSNLQQPMQSADIQREKAYGLAESLNSQLDDVNRNLNIMVEEINRMGSSKQASADEDDVVGQIVQILNSHLSSLQWIDTHSTELQAKIQEVSKMHGDIASNVHFN